MPASTGYYHCPMTKRCRHPAIKRGITKLAAILRLPVLNAIISKGISGKDGCRQIASACGFSMRMCCAWDDGSLACLNLGGGRAPNGQSGHHSDGGDVKVPQSMRVRHHAEVNPHTVSACPMPRRNLFVVAHGCEHPYHP